MGVHRRKKEKKEIRGNSTRSLFYVDKCLYANGCASCQVIFINLGLTLTGTVNKLIYTYLYARNVFYVDHLWYSETERRERGRKCTLRRSLERFIDAHSSLGAIKMSNTEMTK